MRNAQSRGRLKLAALAVTTLFACGPQVPAEVAATEIVFYQDSHQSGASLDPGERFTVALPWTPKVDGVFARDPRRPRTDGKVVHLVELGRMPAALEGEAGGPGLAYVFEVLAEGRGKVQVFDSAHRERFLLRVNVGKEAQRVKRSTDKGRPRPRVTPPAPPAKAKAAGPS